MKAMIALLGIALCGSSLGQTGQSTPADALAEALIAKSKAVPQAVQAKDVKMLNELLAGDFKKVGSAGHIQDRAEALGEAEEGMVRDFMFYDPMVTHIDDNSAIVTYNLIVTMPEGDDLFAPRYQKISDLWVKDNGEWRLKFEQATPLRSID